MSGKGQTRPTGCFRYTSVQGPPVELQAAQYDVAVVPGAEVAGPIPSRPRPTPQRRPAIHPTAACGKLTRRPKPSGRAMDMLRNLAAILAAIADEVIE